MDQKKGLLMIEVSERAAQKWKVIQTAAILPLILSVAFLLKFKGSMLGVVVFFLILIVGVILPQIYRDFITAQLQLEAKVEELRKQILTASQAKG